MFCNRITRSQIARAAKILVAIMVSVFPVKGRQLVASKRGAGAFNFILNSSLLQKQGLQFLTLWWGTFKRCPGTKKSNGKGQSNKSILKYPNRIFSRKMDLLHHLLWRKVMGKHFLRAHTNSLTLSSQNRALKTPQHEQISSLLIYYDFIQWEICMNNSNMHSIPVIFFF